MSDIVTTIFESFVEVIQSLATGIKTAFIQFIYADPDAAEKTLSAPFEFLLIFMGISIAIGLVYGAIRMVSRRV